MGAFVVREVQDGRQGESAITRERKHFSKIHESNTEFQKRALVSVAHGQNERTSDVSE